VLPGRVRDDVANLGAVGGIGVQRLDAARAITAWDVRSSSRNSWSSISSSKRSAIERISARCSSLARSVASSMIGSSSNRRVSKSWRTNCIEMPNREGCDDIALRAESAGCLAM